MHLSILNQHLISQQYKSSVMCNSSLEDLFLLVKESNEDAFDELYHRTWKKLYEIALRRLQHENTAKEVIQDLYIDLWEKRHRKTIQDVDHYLCQAVRFKVIDRFRKEKRYFEELETMVEELSDGSTADGNYIQTELESMLHNWIARMPQKRREIFLLRYNEDKTVKEIAKLLGLSTKTVQNQLLNTTNALKLLIQKILFMFF
ncbi:sigma-70 family RNA polymerase sigma factor [Sphingobacterium siyangense]|nr:MULTISPECIES: sigma-70 family RNA polymerase sigma factor [Sphingobacterium]UQA77357.1 sigma-70 family RNA polymerase sigma factor [Sphingobacterium siyangense]